MHRMWWCLLGRGSGGAPKAVLCRLSAYGDGGKNGAQRTHRNTPTRRAPTKKAGQIDVIRLREGIIQD